MNIETTIIDDKCYMEVDKINVKDNNYVFLVNKEDEKDFCIRKLVAIEDKIFYEGLDDDKEFELVLAHFIKRHENILSEE